MINISAYWYKAKNNFGDWLNLDVLSFLGVELFWSDAGNCQLMGIGSILNELLSNTIKPSNSPVAIWGSGFRSVIRKDRTLKRPVQVTAVRGRYTKSILENQFGVQCPAVYGDPGLFANELIVPKSKKYRIGIIPHVSHTELNCFKKVNNDEDVLIDLTQEPIKVIEQISECEYIVSESLHGLIVADSLGIPNLRLRIMNKNLEGVNFKFGDYYSAYPAHLKQGAAHLLTQYDNIRDIKISRIRDKYQPKEKEIEQLKAGLRSALQECWFQPKLSSYSIQGIKE
jgi:pyruvyltransferase